MYVCMYYVRAITYIIHEQAYVALVKSNSCSKIQLRGVRREKERERERVLREPQSVVHIYEQEGDKTGAYHPLLSLLQGVILLL